MEPSDTSWSSATNWISVRGSLETNVTVESSLSLINDDENENLDQSSTVYSTAKSPLILLPSPPNCSPCEITITFAQRHELRQVYVRSTARVYEIYCISELGSTSEYLCTVRCGIATRDGEVLHAPDTEEAVFAHHKGSSKELAEERPRNGGNLTTNEDDWVEVKVLDTPLFVSGNSSLLSSSSTSQGRKSQLQDLFEATAEITDANPCMAIKLKLLSLQNKGCVCIDEVYVFADPVDATELDNKVGMVESTTRSSLMAMFMPTILELSKTKSVGGAMDKYDTDKMSGQKSQTVKEEPCDPVDAGNKVLQGGKSGLAYKERVESQEAVTPIVKPFELETSPQVSDTESKHDIPDNHIESVLNHLVSRVNRIEDLFVRFEDCMLKPIRSIDERLQRVEQHLEVLTKKTQNAGLLSCTRISAPEFSCSESETNSLYNSGCVDPCEANKKDSVPAESFISSDVTPISVNTTKSHPSLVVNAPEFSNGDDDEECDAAEPVKDSPKEKQKNSMSIDDALASALAGFLSSISVQSPKYSKALEVKAPEFPNEDGNNSDETALEKGHHEIIMELRTCSGKYEGIEQLRNSSSSLSNFSSLESDEIETRDNNHSKTGEGGDEELHNGEDDEDGDAKGVLSNVKIPAMGDMVITNASQITDDTENEVGNGTGKTSEPEKTGFLELFSADQIEDGSCITKDYAISNEIASISEVKKEQSDPDILQSVVEISHAYSKVDFAIPILEVKFTCAENSDVKSPLEALLAGVQGFNIEDSSLRESNKDNCQPGDQYNLIPIEDCGATVSAAGSNVISVDADYCNLTALHLPAEDVGHFI